MSSVRQLFLGHAQPILLRLSILWFLFMGYDSHLSSTAYGQDATAEPSTGQADASNSIPPALTEYMGRQIAQTMSFHGAPWLIRDDRELEEKSSLALRQLQLEPGMRVCDLGCGNGYWSLMMSRMVGDNGRVLAVDIQPEMLHLLQLRCEESNITNIDAIEGTLVDPRLPGGSLDLILLVDVYHEFSHPEQMLSKMRRALKDTGVVALLEYREEDPRVPIKPLHKMSKRQILREYRANGFKLAREFDELPWQHLMFFQRDPNWQTE
ncbi:MAG: methyltransferase domain-containing protein [Planctomycetales bacterium]|nr:methyltransferase domain-containing protein [Planctomycetales bacterium]